MNKILNYMKNNLSTVIYGAFGVVTIIGASILVSWAIKSNSISVLDADVVVSDKTQTEYLVGQQINTSDLYLNIGTKSKPNLIPANKCMVDASLSSAGTKKVTLTYSYDEYTNYQGEFYVNVLFVRSIEIDTMPTKIKVNEDGKTFTANDFSLYAEVSEKPKTSYFDYEKISDSYYKIKLTADMYSTSAVMSSKIEDYYTANVYCGNLSYQFDFYNVDDQTFYVDSEKDVVKFTSNSNVELELVITNKDESYQTNCVGNTKGYYIFKTNDKYDFVDFDFTLTTHEEQFKSKNVVETFDDVNNKYEVLKDGNKFSVEANLWQSAVVNGLIYNEGGYKLVADSDSRVLHLTNTSEDGTTLTLYVTKFNFDTSTGGGISEGFYIYKDSYNEYHRIKFFMQTWTWDYVPLSVTKQECASEEIPDISIVDYLTTKYIGDMNVSITAFKRGEGFKTSTFVATFGEWRLVAYNMA